MNEVTSFITVFLMRSITIEELQGFRDALLELCVRVDLDEYKRLILWVPAVMERIPLTSQH